MSVLESCRNAYFASCYLSHPEVTLCVAIENLVKELVLEVHGNSTQKKRSFVFPEAYPSAKGRPFGFIATSLSSLSYGVWFKTPPAT